VEEVISGSGVLLLTGNSGLHFHSLHESRLVQLTVDHESGRHQRSGDISDITLLPARFQRTTSGMS